MEFLILGTLEVREHGRLLAVGGPRQRALLAVLLLNANRVVAREQLLEDLGSDETSETASHALTNQISRLRKVLGEGRLLTQSPGYRLRVDSGELDCDRFEALLNAGRAARDPHLAEQRLREAEGLWRGRALADVELDGRARIALERLEELRLSAVEARIEAELKLGRHDVLVAELDALAREHPLRERLRAQQMLALYRAGRQQEALAVYRHTRAQLVEQVGLEPGPQLRELEGAILRQDPALAPARRTARRLAAIGSGGERFCWAGWGCWPLRPRSPLLPAVAAGPAPASLPASYCSIPPTATSSHRSIRVSAAAMWCSATDGSGCSTCTRCRSSRSIRDAGASSANSRRRSRMWATTRWRATGCG